MIRCHCNKEGHSGLTLGLLVSPQSINRGVVGVELCCRGMNSVSSFFHGVSGVRSSRLGPRQRNSWWGAILVVRRNFGSQWRMKIVGLFGLLCVCSLCCHWFPAVSLFSSFLMRNLYVHKVFDLCTTGVFKKLECLSASIALCCHWFPWASLFPILLTRNLFVHKVFWFVRNRGVWEIEMPPLSHILVLRGCLSRRKNL